MFWVLGGLVCHAYDGIQNVTPRQQSAHNEASKAEPKKIEERKQGWRTALNAVSAGLQRKPPPPKYRQ